MARYDAIQGAGNVTVNAPPDFWTSAKQSFDDDYDRLTLAQQRKKEEQRYNSEKLEEQTRYNTQREEAMFQQRYDKAVAEHQAAVADYTLSSEQIPSSSPDMQGRLNKSYNKEYRIPRKDGTFETRKVVPQAVIDYNTAQVTNKTDFDDTLNNWFKPVTDGGLSNKQKIAAWPRIKMLNRVFNEQIEPYEASYKRALSYDGNAKLLDTMGAFLPAGYDATKWEDATKILLKDGEVSEADLKIIANDISSHITNRTDARKFWTNFSSDIMKARGALKLDSDPTTIRDLQGLSDIALGKLDEWYGISGDVGYGGALGKEEYNKKANEVSQRLHGVNIDELEPSQIPGVEEEIDIELSKQPAKQAGFIGDKTIRGPFEQPPQDEESTVDFEKGTIEWPRDVKGEWNASWFDRMKTATPKDLGYASMESLIEGEFAKQKKSKPDFISTYFNNDKDVWRKWFTGKRTMSSMPIPVPQRGKKVIASLRSGVWGNKGIGAVEDRGKKIKWGEEEGVRTVDPLSGEIDNGQEVKNKINKNKVKFANLGIIAKEEWPFWDRVGKEKARQSLRK